MAQKLSQLQEKQKIYNLTEKYGRNFGKWLKRKF